MRSYQLGCWETCTQIVSALDFLNSSMPARQEVHLRVLEPSANAWSNSGICLSDTIYNATDMVLPSQSNEVLGLVHPK